MKTIAIITTEENKLVILQKLSVDVDLVLRTTANDLLGKLVIENPTFDPIMEADLMIVDDSHLRDIEPIQDHLRTFKRNNKKVAWIVYILPEEPKTLKKQFQDESGMLESHPDYLPEYIDWLEGRLLDLI